MNDLRAQLHVLLDEAYDDALKGGDGAIGFIDKQIDGISFGLAFSVANRFVQTAILNFPECGYGSQYNSGQYGVDAIAAQKKRRAEQQQ